MYLPGEKRYESEKRPPSHEARSGRDVLRAVAIGGLILIGIAALVALVIGSDGAFTFDLPSFWRKDDGDGPLT